MATFWRYASEQQAVHGFALRAETCAFKILSHFSAFLAIKANLNLNGLESAHKNGQTRGRFSFVFG
jgi:hypothetical protein